MKKIFLSLLISSTIFSQQKENLYTLKYDFLMSLHDEKAKYEYVQCLPHAFNPAISEILPKKKSPGLAILYSMLIPGMGELYANNYASGKYFTIADGILWGFFAGFNIYGKWKEDNYKTFAMTRGGVNLEGKDSDYFATIGIFISIEEYNRLKELNRDFYNVYDPKTFYWKWESENQRKEYRQMWLSSEQAYNNLRFVVGALILNRIISAINAVRLVNAYNRSISSAEWNINISTSNNYNLPPTVLLNFTKSF
ncbi:MAG: hypothetical protein N2249_04325 [Melioribacter sp.]|nr:hypothetical protein [Melioribacter sp.]